jgi:hypothetical protein
MEKAKFTKGPWVLFSGGNTFIEINDHKGMDVISSGGFSEFHSSDQNEANAHLIKMAPEMYELLEFIASAPLAAPHKAVEIKKLLAKARGE